MMAAYEQNDARDAVRLLAIRTLDGLRAQEPTSLLGNAINNMYRLLQSYRSHGFYGYAERARSEDEGSMTSLLSSSDRNVGELRIALDETFEIVFEGEDPGVVIDRMKTVMRMAAYPEDGERPDPDDVAQAQRFFSVFLDKLKA